MNTKNLITRAGAGFVYVLVILLGVLGGRYSFLTVFGAILAMGLFEFYRLVEKNTPHSIGKIVNIVFGVLIFYTVYLYLEDKCSYALPATILTYLLFLLTSSIFSKRNDVFQSVVYSAFGQLYITLPLSLLMLISYQYNAAIDGYHYVPVLALFVSIWVNDTGAYLVGSLIGKHRLIERISPKKSVEGFIGGIVSTVLVSLIFARFFPEYPAFFWIVFAVIVSLFSTLGDLFESLIKRTYAVKDAGHLIPGHGGILDRIDSLLMAVPAIYVYLMIFGAIAN